jgi:hypothetical protein
VPLGQEFRVNSYTTGSQADARVASTGSAQFVVVWKSLGQDGFGYGVFGHRFDFGNGMIKVERPNTNVKWRISSVQKIQWTHNLGADATFRIELDRDDDGTFEELIAAEEHLLTAPRGAASPGASRARVLARPACASRGRTIFQSPTPAT